MSASELQTAVYARLSGYAGLTAIISAVYDHVPQDPAFPYVVIGEDTSTPLNTRSSVGSDNTVTVHTWSRYRGRIETKNIQRQVYLALNRYAISVSGFSLIDCQFEYADSFIDPDGLTRHGVQRFRVMVDGG